MARHNSSKLTCALFFGALLAALSLSTPVNAKACEENTGGACKGHWKCDDNDSSKTCEDVVKSSGMECQCIKKKKKTHGPNISLGIGVGPGGGVAIGIGGPDGGIGFDVNTGGYCDSWGCPYEYWNDPVFYGPVYFGGVWYYGPVYYREFHGEDEYWIHGAWHTDQWQGERPDWARDVHYGPALGHDYYQSDAFRQEAERYNKHHNYRDHHDSDRGFQPEAGIRWDHNNADKPGGDHHDNDHKKSRDSHSDKDKDNQSWPHN